MKVPKTYAGGGSVKGDPKNPSKSKIDRSRYQAILSRPMVGSDGNFIADDPNAFSPAVLAANGYKYHSGSMGNKDIAYEKNGNVYIYNEQPGAAQNKYGLINIGNPNASDLPVNMNAAQTPVKTATLPTIDPNRKPLDFNSSSLAYDPNTGKYYNNITGLAVAPIIQQYKKGGVVGKINGYLNGTTASGIPTKSDGTYASAFANANSSMDQNIEEDKKKRNINSGAFQAAGGAAMGLGSTALEQAGVQDQNPALNSSIDNTAASLTPWYGLAKGASDFGRSKIKRDKNGNPITDEGKAVDTLLKPQHQHAQDAYNREGLGGVAKEFLLGASSMRAAADLFGKGDQTTGLWGKINKFSGNTAINKEAADKLKKEQEDLSKLQADEQRAIDQGRIAEAIALRETGDSSGSIPYVRPGEMTQGNFKAPFTQALNQSVAALNPDSVKGIKGQFNLARKFALGKKDGGEITGPGTGKSDSIKAKVKPGSFVVPEENADVAEAIRTLVLKAPKTKAKLTQKGGTEVYLSNGEHLFDPKEKQQIVQSGIDLGALAPNAQGNNPQAPRPDGGADDVPHAQRATKWGGMKDGGGVKKAPKKKLEEMSDEELDDEILKREYGITSEISSERRKAHRKQIYGELGDKIKSKKATPREVQFYNQLAKEFGGSQSSTSSTARRAPIAKRTAPVSEQSSNGLTPAQMSELARLRPSLDNDAGDGSQPLVVPQNTLAAGNLPAINPTGGKDLYNVDTTGSDTMAPVINPANPSPQGGGSRERFNLGSLVDYGIPLLQAGLGLKYLKDAGKRPEDKLDPDYLRSIDTARANVVTANANAKYGFSAEEQALLNMQNQNLTNAGRYSARNLTGGSSAAALGLERSVLNDSFGRTLQNQVANKRLMFDKQQIANDRQQYLDNLVAGKVRMSNRLFDMKLDAWNQQQATAAGLIGAAAQNAIGAKQWNDELRMAKQREAKYNPQYPTGI